MVFYQINTLNMKLRHLISIAAAIIAMSGNAQMTKTLELTNWEFSRDGNSWQAVTIPHDWAISGPFDI